MGRPEIKPEAHLFLVTNDGEQLLGKGCHTVDASDRLVLKISDPANIIRIDVIHSNDTSDKKTLLTSVGNEMDIGSAGDFRKGLIINVRKRKGNGERISCTFDLIGGSGVPTPPPPDPWPDDTNKMDPWPDDTKRTDPWPDDTKRTDPWPPKPKDDTKDLAYNEDLEKKKELEKKRDDLAKDLEELQAEIDKEGADIDTLTIQLSSRQDDHTALKKKNEDLAEAIKQLTNIGIPDKERALTAKKNDEAVILAQYKAVENNVTALQGQKKTAEEEERVLTAECARLQAALVDLRQRHTDLEREVQDIKNLRAAKGMQDEERERLTKDIVETERTIESLDPQLKEVSAKAEELQNEFDEKCREKTKLEESIDKYRHEIEEMTRINREEGEEWRRLVMSFSELLSEVLTTHFNLEDTYRLLEQTLQSDLVRKREAEAADKKKLLEKCAATLHEVNDWVADIRTGQIH